FDRGDVGGGVELASHHRQGPVVGLDVRLAERAADDLAVALEVAGDGGAEDGGEGADQGRVLQDAGGAVGDDGVAHPLEQAQGGLDGVVAGGIGGGRAGRTAGAAPRP